MQRIAPSAIPGHLTQALFSAAIALGRTREADEVARVAIAELQRATGIEAVALHVVDRDQGGLVLRAFAGTINSVRQRMGRLPLHQLPTAARAIRQRSVVTWDLREAEPSAVADAYTADGFRHVTWVPVEGREDVLGVLQLAARQEQLLGPDERSLVEAIGGLVGVALENAALHDALTVQRDRLRALAERAMQAHEEEARRIARELHDEAGQLLASVHIALDGLAQRTAESAETIQRLHELLDRVEEQLRRLSRELRPTILDDLGLGPALEWLTQGIHQRTGIRISVRAAIGRLEAGVETALYRIVQEALTNAVRHGRASAIDVQVRERDGAAEAVVRDDGIGFDARESLSRRGEPGLGLLGMRERAEALGGRLDLDSSPGRGTAVSVIIPLGRAS